MADTTTTHPKNGSFVRTVWPLMFSVLVGFIAIGVALPVLPYHVHDTLGFGTFAVGLVTGFQFAASLLSRFYAGRYADKQGGKRAMQLGLVLTAVGGGVYALSYVAIDAPLASISILLIGRAIIGGAESFIITGGMTLGLSMVGANSTGRVIAWVGTAMFAALAIGAPIGTFVSAHFGFLAIAVTTILLPLAALLPVRILHAPVTGGGDKGSIVLTLRRVWLPGLGAALNGVGFSALISFSVLVFAQNGWEMSWLPLSAFAVALIAARVCLGQLIDRIGGKQVGLCFTIVLGCGQFIIWLSGSPWIAALGAGLTGLGWAMVYPAFGAEAVQRVGANNKGLAMAAYSAFPDLAIGLASPILGLSVSAQNIQGAYIWSALVVVAAAPISFLLRNKATVEASINVPRT